MKQRSNLKSIMKKPASYLLVGVLAVTPVSSLYAKEIYTTPCQPTYTVQTNCNTIKQPTNCFNQVEVKVPQLQPVRVPSQCSFLKLFLEMISNNCDNDNQNNMTKPLGDGEESKTGEGRERLSELAHHEVERVAAAWMD